jgi:hypothetical protein
MNKNTSPIMEGTALTTPLKKLWKNEYFQTAVVIGVIVLVVFGFWFGSQVVLNTPIPAVAVVSGSMCIPYDSVCDGWTHPFARTLHIGDLLIVQGVNPKDLNTNYPNSDIIVFQRPDRPDDPDAKIVHRIVGKVEVNGTLYFYTKGDGNSGYKWPTDPQGIIYSWRPSPSDPSSTYNGAVRQDFVYGRVVMRIPWLGHIVLFMNQKTNPIGLPIIVALIILLVIIEFVVPLLRGKKEPEQQKEAQQQP